MQVKHDARSTGGERFDGISVRMTTQRKYFTNSSLGIFIASIAASVPAFADVGVLSTGHPRMPEFPLESGQVGDFISFLKSLE
jgi:hypothetical protein